MPPVDVFDHIAIGEPYSRKEVPIQINHYSTKSYEEYKEKDIKGDVFFSHPTHEEYTFFLRDMRSTVADYNIFKYLTELKKRMKE